jgi:hypothetical protein
LLVVLLLLVKETMAELTVVFTMTLILAVEEVALAQKAVAQQQIIKQVLVE